MRRRLARLILKVSGWRAVGVVPQEGVLVGAPHTSNWDFILMLLVMWNGGVPPRVLIKKELFIGPLGWFLRKSGGIAIDRSHPGGLVEELAEQAGRGESFLVIIAAEGTRKKVQYWKSGFYRIAQATNLPIALAFVDGPSKTAGFGPSLHPSGDVVADMNLIRAFYADKHGVRPAFRTEPRLREELPNPPS